MSVYKTRLVFAECIANIINGRLYNPWSCGCLTFLLWLNTEKSLLRWVAELSTGLLGSEMTVVARDNIITALDSMMELTVATLDGLNTFFLSTDEYVGGAWYAGSLIFNILRWMVSLVCWVLAVLCSYYTIHRQIPTNHQ